MQRPLELMGLQGRYIYWAAGVAGGAIVGFIAALLSLWALWPDWSYWQLSYLRESCYHPQTAKRAAQQNVNVAWVCVCLFAQSMIYKENHHGNVWLIDCWTRAGPPPPRQTCPYLMNEYRNDPIYHFIFHRPYVRVWPCQSIRSVRAASASTSFRISISLWKIQMVGAVHQDGWIFRRLGKSKIRVQKARDIDSYYDFTHLFSVLAQTLGRICLTQTGHLREKTVREGAEHNHQEFLSASYSVILMGVRTRTAFWHLTITQEAKKSRSFLLR